MRLWVIVEAWHPDDGSGGLRWNRFSRCLAERGHDVTVIIEKRTILEECMIDGVRLIPLPPISTPAMRIRQWLRGVFERRYAAGNSAAATKSRQPSASAVSSPSSVKTRFIFFAQRVTRRIFALMDFPDNGYTGGKRVAADLMMRGLARPDVILGSLPSSGGARAASILSAAWGVPYLIDFRDPWSRFYTVPLPGFLFRRKLLVEKWLVEGAAGVIYLNRVLARYVEGTAKRYIHVPNGFERASVAPSLEAGAAASPGAVTLIYTGVIEDGRTGRFMELLRYVHKFNQEESGQGAATLEIHYYGTSGPRLRALMTAQGLGDERWLIDHGRVPRTTALAAQRAASLLVNLGNDAAGLAADCVQTGKIFEYLAARRPVLCIDSPDNKMMTEVVMDTAAGWVLDDYETFAGIMRRFTMDKRSFLAEWEAGLRHDVISLYCVENQAVEVEKFLKECAIGASTAV